MKGTRIEEKAYAKINLALHVTGVQKDGYHVLDSIVVFANVFDRLTITLAKKYTLNFTGEFAEYLDTRKNSILEVFNLFHNRSVDKFSINLQKNLPVGAGLGGGSADAALLRFITNYYSYPLPSLQIVQNWAQIYLFVYLVICQE